MASSPKLPGRLGNPDLTLGTDPRADPRMVAKMVEVGLDVPPPPSAVQHDSPMDAIQ